MPRKAAPRYDPAPVRRIIKERGLTYQELADRSGLSLIAVRQYLWKPVTWRVADLLACALGSHPGSLWPCWLDDGIAVLPEEDPWIDWCRVEYGRPWWSNCREHQGR